ncbi:MAG: phosphotransferase family protein [bacterium]|nr:phosphotransferase family protein [bacterium]
MSDLEARLAAYISTQLPDVEELQVRDLDRIFGGASRETYRFVLSYRDGTQPISRPLILRRDPPGSLIETERAIEFGAYRAFYGTSVPVPEALWLEEDERWLDYPFFVMEELVGFEAGPQAIVAPPYAQHAQSYAERKWAILGEISRADPKALGLFEVMESVAPDLCWKRELEYWEARIDRDELCPQPIIRAAIRWLRRNPPPAPTRLSVVHGDFRTGNFLYDDRGGIHGILDWEMAHLGDPLEDLAWSINPVWRWARDERAGGLVSNLEAIRIWEQASGFKADPDALHWWEVFSSVKGQAIWVSGAKEFTDGKNQDFILALSAWLVGNSQDRAVLHTLGRLT